MISKVTETIKEPMLGIATTGAFLGISFQNVLEWLQLGSVVLSIIVALLTVYLTVLKIRNEKIK
ncbi:MAG: hypothetical protein MJ204_02635 [Bacteroidales bacterium]|nr:hypothetical protein [Bacteroidales bacterium]MCQ2605424.1 hypothetical protein [Bacteroidales bacterium]